MATSITALPAVPSRNGAPDTFANDADLFIGALPTFRTEANLLAVEAEADALTASNAATTATTQAGIATTKAAAAAASAVSAVNAPGTSATSTTSVLVGTGSKSLTVQTGKAFVVGQFVTIARTSAPSTTSMFGIVTAYTSGTGALVVSVTSITGSGTFTDWTIALSAPAVTNLPFSSITSKPTTISGYGITNAPNKANLGSVDLNTAVNSGFYRIEVPTNAPPDVNYGQLIVSGGDIGDTVLQIVTGYTAGIVWFRHGNPPDVGGTGTWSTWRPLGGNDYVNLIGGNTTATSNQTYVLLVSLTLALPASPIAGDWVKISNRSATITAVVARNGQNIMGLAEDMTFDNLNAGVTLVFADATRGWVIV